MSKSLTRMSKVIEKNILTFILTIRIWYMYKVSLSYEYFSKNRNLPDYIRTQREDSKLYVDSEYIIFKRAKIIWEFNEYTKIKHL